MTIRTAVLCAWLVLPGAVLTARQPPLELVATVALPRVEGRIDHCAFDPKSRRLFVAALGNDTVEVVDLQTNTHLQSVSGFAEPQGLAFVPTVNAAAVANGKDGRITWLSPDGKAGRSVAVGDDADNVRWDAAAQRLYVGYGAGALAAIDPARDAVVGRVPLPGHPEAFQLETHGPRVFVNVPGAKALAIVDRRTMTVSASWPLSAADDNYPLALDEDGHRLFVGCRRPPSMLVLDSTTGQQIGSVPTVGDTDDVFFDGVRQRVYVSGGEGAVDVFDARAGQGYARIARVPTLSGARTSLLVPTANVLVVAAPKRNGHAAQLLVFGLR